MGSDSSEDEMRRRESELAEFASLVERNYKVTAFFYLDLSDFKKWI